MITPVVYSDFLLQKTGLVSEVIPKLLIGCGLSFATVWLYSLLNPGEIDATTQTKCKVFNKVVYRKCIKTCVHNFMYFYVQATCTSVMQPANAE